MVGLWVSDRFGLFRPPNIQSFPWSVSHRGQSVTRSAPYRGIGLQLYYTRPTTTALNRETQLQVVENYLSEQPAHLLLGLHCEKRPEYYQKTYNLIIKIVYP